jgi:hypothetical protein
MYPADRRTDTGVLFDEGGTLLEIAAAEQKMVEHGRHPCLRQEQARPDSAGAGKD